MKITAFLVLRNELERGNLRRCLDNCKAWSDQIVIYDDYSTDGSQDIYTQYTDKDLIIFGEKNEFHMELFHKQQLLTLALKTGPDWIGWIDGDAVFDNLFTHNLREQLEPLPPEIDGIKMHNKNLWKSESWCRYDNEFDKVFHITLWKNTGNLRFNSLPGLHQSQSPLGLINILSAGRLIHYGFSSREKIIEKYLRYKGCGQTGWALDRLIDEQSSFVLGKALKIMYPEELIPEDYDIAEKPAPETYNEIQGFNSYEEYVRSNKFNI